MTKFERSAYDKLRYRQKLPRNAVDLAKAAARTALYRKRHPERVLAYKQRPESKQAMAIAQRRYRAKWTAEQRAQVTIQLRNAKLKKAYGITSNDYDAMLLKQNGVCAICHQVDNTKHRYWTNRLHVDHCHQTGIVRGLLCWRCNISLGRIGDDPELALSMAAYLKAVKVFS